MRSALDDFIISAARRAGDTNYDSDARLVRVRASYNPSHTRIHTGTPHDFRCSTSYALALLESGEFQRAEDVLAAVLSAQDTDPESNTYGLWSYYLEEPLDRMTPPDWNWADFIGRDLSLILLRHGSALSERTAMLCREGLRHAARSIMRRDVAVTYTNIAAKGGFVVLAAGRLCEDETMVRYGMKRLRALEEEVRGAGGVVEYGSPVYWVIALQAVAAIVQYLGPIESATRIEQMLWDEFGRHWHAGINEWIGPMSRCYSESAADNNSLMLTLAKASGLTDPAKFAPTRRPSSHHDVHVGVLELHPSDEALQALRRVETRTRQAVREVRVPRRFTDSAADRPKSMAVKLSQWVDADHALGSASISELWVQRRPLIGHWMHRRADEEPLRGQVRLRLLKDGYDWASGVLTSVQEGNAVLWHVGLASPAGDRHLIHRPIEPDVAFAAKSVIVRVELSGLVDPELSADDSVVEFDEPRNLGQTLTVRTAAVQIDHTVMAGRWNGEDCRIVPRCVGDRVYLDAILVDAASPVSITLAEVADAFACGSLRMSPEHSPAPAPPQVNVTEREATLTWRIGPDLLHHVGSTRIESWDAHVDRHDRRSTLHSGSPRMV